MNHNLEVAIDHIRSLHGLMAATTSTTGATYELDGQAFFTLADDTDSIKIVIHGDDKTDDMHIWYYHFGDFNTVIDNEIKRRCANSSQWHRQMAQWHGDEALHHTDVALKAANRAVKWAWIAVVFATLGVLSNVLALCIKYGIFE